MSCISGGCWSNCRAHPFAAFFVVSPAVNDFLCVFELVNEYGELRAKIVDMRFFFFLPVERVLWVVWCGVVRVFVLIFCETR